MDDKKKMKIIIPIIPSLLSYETEVDMKKLWEQVKPIFIEPNEFGIDKKFLEPKIRKNKNYEKELKNAHKEQNLVLVLGAGVSAKYNLPSWNELLHNLLITTLDNSEQKASVISKLFTHLFNPNTLIAGRYLQNYYNSNNLNFEEAIKKVLYKDIVEEGDSELVKELVNYCVAPGNTPNINSIITYNYDDILEHEINKLNIDVPYKAIYGVGMLPGKNELPIYHVHGYIPRIGDLTEDNLITLGEEIYHKQYSNIYSWNNIVQINKFRENSCLFIGISLSDPNMRRLLDIARMQSGTKSATHYLFKKRHDVEKIKILLKKTLDENKGILDEKNRVSLKFEEVAKIMVDLITEFEENDFQSLGVNIIWVNDFDEIPKILKKIRLN